MTGDGRHVLLIDDDQNLVGFLGDRLERDGYEVSRASGGMEALTLLDESWPDLIVLDLMLPGMTGEELARRIKQRADIPVIILSAVSASDSKVDLISRYAEDYVTKPFNYSELRARMQRVIRRMGAQVPARELVLGPDLTLFLQRRQVVMAGQRRTLSPVEARFLSVLASRLGDVVATEDILTNVWAETDAAEPVYVWVTVRRLRRKIEVEPDAPRHLLTEPGGGYRLVQVGAATPS